ncbi:MAG: geranylgeranyl reductase family protein [Actinomycetaceae bacterium]|nr:geranylgeranyl reductase family protein [Actinomycetaceae bacterium]
MTNRSRGIKVTQPLKDGSSCQVAIVGAGPGGSAAAYHLAQAGVDVILLEKSQFPRDKVCGDGLTPHAVREILAMGIRPHEEEGWQFNKGLTVIGGGHTLHLPWPEQESFPGYGMARARTSLDERLAKRAVEAGACLYENSTVVGPITENNKIVGVQVSQRGADRKKLPPVGIRARYVIDAGGVSARLATSMGIKKLENRPIAVAARAYFRSPRADEQWMESHLELWDGKPNESNLLPGYGWMFPLGNGLVNVGLGSVSSDAKATKIAYRKVFQQWVSNLPKEWGFVEENMEGPLRSAALPMAFNRKPHYRNNLVLVGDSAGMVSPFNGEGIAPAMTSARIAAQCIVQALGRTNEAGAEKVMQSYPRLVSQHYGGYYTLGRGFVRLIERPEIMRICTKYGLGHPGLMSFVHKLLSDGYERRGGDISDRVIQKLAQVVPKS